MIIDKEQLISLLIDKTGLEAEEIEDQLTELINRIQQAAQEDKSFEIESFGTFDMEEGTLQFEPSDTLETEINNKYAGMKPIELIGAFKEPEGDEVPEITEEPDEGARWAFDEAATEEETAKDPVVSLDESEEDEPTPKDVYEQIFGSEKQAVSEQGRQDQTGGQPENQEKKSEIESDTLGRLLVAAVVIIALGVGGWVTYDLGFSGSSQSEQQWTESAPQQAQMPAQQTGDTQPESDSRQESSADEPQEASEPEEENSVVNKEESQSTEAERQSRFGLKGELDQSAGGFTIVVHSLRSIEKAENIRNNFQAAGFRSLVTQAEVRGTTYYRVGIGQFETVGDAQQALNEIPERYKESNFIKRIR